MIWRVQTLRRCGCACSRIRQRTDKVAQPHAPQDREQPVQSGSNGYAIGSCSRPVSFSFDRHSMNKRIASDVGTIVGGGIAIALLIALPAWTTTLFEQLGALVPESFRIFVGSSIFIIVLLGGGRLAGYTTGRFVALMKKRA